MITSTDNNLIKKVIKLADKKYRDEFDSFIIEGYRAVKDSIGKIEIETILLSESASKKYLDQFKCEIVSDKVFNKIASTEQTQGVLCIAKRKKKSDSIYDYCLFLDGVRDPGNVGTILRTAMACGFNTVITNNCVDIYNPKVVRSSMSAIAKLNIIDSDERVLDSLKSNNYSILCADMGGVSIFEFEKNLHDKVCLIVGNEANGVSESVQNKADYIISLPMQEGMESLNVAVATAVCMYELKYNK